MREVDPIYRELAARIGGEEFVYLPQILEKLTSMEQARIVQALPDTDRDPSAGRSLQVSEEFARKLDLEKKVVDNHIQELFEKGLLFPTSKGPQLARNVGQLHDTTLFNPQFDDSLGSEFFDLWAAWSGEKTKPAPEDCPSEKGALMRVIPKWRVIKDVPGILPFEDMREILKKQDLIVLGHCPCKRSYHNRECNMPDEVCIVVDRSAEYNLSRGVGKKLTYEEALKFFDECDHYPLVNCVINQRNVTQLICNCHWCCCASLGKDTAKSRFVAEVDPQKCRACRICADKMCQFGAARMKFYPELGEERAYIDPELCRGCGSCVVSCPSQARTMKLVRPPEHVPETFGRDYL